MSTSIPATFDGTAFVPDGPVPGLTPGQRVSLTVADPEPEFDQWGKRRMPPYTPENLHLWRAELEKEYPEEPGEETLLELIDRIAVDDPSVPTDLAAQHDHYASGAPKR